MEISSSSSFEETLILSSAASSSSEVLITFSSSSSDFRGEPPPFSEPKYEEPPVKPEEPTFPQESPFLIGADISNFQRFESIGVKIYDVDGSEKDIFKLLKDHGFNAIRLKTFVSPRAKYGYTAEGCAESEEAFGDKEHILAYAKKVKNAGFKFLLDIHYSDNWADPGKQAIPERWRNVMTAEAMADSVYAYTYDLIAAFKNEGTLPDMVQVGNEITNGLLRDLPTANTNCWGENLVWAPASINGEMSSTKGKDNTALYLKSGLKAVKDVSSNIKTVLHIESLKNQATIEWWMREIFDIRQVKCDVMAFSAYTAYGDGSPADWKRIITNQANRYPDLEFLIAEYNGGSRENSYDFDGSRLETNLIMREVPRGIGAFFWEPANSGAWGTGLFEWRGNGLYAIPRAFEELAPLKMK